MTAWGTSPHRSGHADLPHLMRVDAGFSLVVLPRETIRRDLRPSRAASSVSVYDPDVGVRN